MPIPPPPPLALLRSATALFRTSADPTRLTILFRLARTPENPRDLSAELGRTPAATAKHLRKLLNQGLVGKRRAGKTVLYSATDRGRAIVEMAGRLRRD